MPIQDKSPLESHTQIKLQATNKMSDIFLFRAIPINTNAIPISSSHPSGNNDVSIEVNKAVHALEGNIAGLGHLHATMRDSLMA